MAKVKQTGSRRVQTANTDMTASADAVARPARGTTSYNGRPAWAVWILSRFPGVRYHYQGWGTTKRVVVAILLYLISLPIIPIVVAAVWYVRDPEGFKKSPLMPVLSALIVAWFGGFGYIANQTPVTDGLPYASTKAAADGENGTVNTDPAATADSTSRSKITNQRTSKPTNGRHFENCTAAFDAGVFDIKRNDPSYERRLDRDDDGIACEK